MTDGTQGTMFSPPAERIFRGSPWGPASSYWFAIAAWAIILGGVGKSSLVGGAVVFGIGVVVFGGMTLFATGTSIEVSPDELVVRRRWRPVWRVPMRDFRYVVENIPTRPRAPSMAGWAFHATDERRVGVELAMFSPLDRKRLRTLFAAVLVDADAGMPRR